MAGYEAADAAGHFSAQPRQAPREEASPPGTAPDFDFDELDADPSERKPGSMLAKRLWAAETKVRQWKWLSVGLLFLSAMFLQSVALYFATRRYVQWVVKLQDGPSNPRELELSMRLLQPRDTFAFTLGIKEASSLPLDLAMLAMPLVWLVAVVTARNLRLWTRTLLSASVLAVFTGVLGSLTMLPQPMGWEACEANLREDVLLHYQGADGPIPEVGKAFGLMCWIWLQDVMLGMRFQGQLVCAGSSLSGCSWFTALFALALYDLSRMWSRKLKVHFREISHLACGGVLTGFVLLDAGVAITNQQQYTAAVSMGLVMAMLVYQSPAMAVCTDQLLIWATPPVHEVAKGDTTPLRETTDFGLFTREDPSRDFGDVVVPPCCIPFCVFHGRYFLYPKPASEYEQELMANLQAQAELEKLQKEQEQSTRRLLELEGQLEALHSRQAKRVEEEPKEFERQLQERLHQQRLVFEEQLARVQAEIEEAEQEKLRLEADAKASARKEELLHASRAVSAKTHLMAQGILTMPADAWTKIYERFGVKAPAGPPDPAAPAPVPAAAQQTKGLEATALACDFRTLPMAAWQRLHQRFAAPPKAAEAPAAAPELVLRGDFRQMPLEAWQRLHDTFGPAPKASCTVLPEAEAGSVRFELAKSLLSAKTQRRLPAHLRPSATPHISWRR